MKKWCILLLILLQVLFSTTSFGAEGEDKLIRLHVIANSDSSYDQRLKLKIRDIVLQQLWELKNMEDINSARKYIISQQEEITNLIKDELAKNGVDYSIEAVLAKSKFPTRRYSNNLLLPAGDYLAFKIIIGKGKGANWWCVLYPPICHGDWVKKDNNSLVQDAKAVTALPENITEEKNREIEEIILTELKKIGQESMKLIIKVWSF